MNSPHLVTKDFGNLRKNDIVDVIGMTAGGSAIYNGYDEDGERMPRPFPREYLVPEHAGAALVWPGESI